MNIQQQYEDFVLQYYFPECRYQPYFNVAHFDQTIIAYQD